MGLGEETPERYRRVGRFGAIERLPELGQLERQGGRAGSIAADAEVHVFDLHDPVLIELVVVSLVPGPVTYGGVGRVTGMTDLTLLGVGLVQERDPGTGWTGWTGRAGRARRTGWARWTGWHLTPDKRRRHQAQQRQPRHG